MANPITFRLNGKRRTFRVDDPQMPLLYALREDAGLHGPRFGCGLKQCGACTVQIDGEAVRSCSYPISRAAGRKVLTLEGLASGRKLHPLQQAFIEEQAVQCGYCINGMIMTSKAFLDARRTSPSEREIRQALGNNLCRCGTHQRIIAAVKRAAVLMGKGA